MSKIETRENIHTSGIYVKRELTIVRGEGAMPYDDQGNALAGNETCIQ